MGDAKRTITIGLFLGLAIIIAVTLTYKFQSKEEVKKEESLSQLTAEQIEALQRCDLPEAQSIIETHTQLACSKKNERKHAITLLVSFPNKIDSNAIRSIYEDSVSITTYSPYEELDAFHMKACTYQTGPWELYCRGANGKCYQQHPPPWKVPYLVKSSYPMYSQMCQSFGYQLPTFDDLILLQRNPIDAIHGWWTEEKSKAKLDNNGFNDTIEYFAEQFVEYVEFWENFYPLDDVKTLVLRYEDFCVCGKHEMVKFFLFTNTYEMVDTIPFLSSININECTEKIGAGIDESVIFILSYLLNIE